MAKYQTFENNVNITTTKNNNIINKRSTVLLSDKMIFLSE
jgi:hypothetical protein